MPAEKHDYTSSDYVKSSFLLFEVPSKPSAWYLLLWSSSGFTPHLCMYKKHPNVFYASFFVCVCVCVKTWNPLRQCFKWGSKRASYRAKCVVHGSIRKCPSAPQFRFHALIFSFYLCTNIYVASTTKISGRPLN